MDEWIATVSELQHSLISLLVCTSSFLDRSTPCAASLLFVNTQVATAADDFDNFSSLSLLG
eukprot:scaffold5992_cov78-Skeletonema_marinoi.AAC.3